MPSRVQDTEQVEIFFPARDYQECIAHCEGFLDGVPNAVLALECAGKSFLALGRLEQDQRFLARPHKLVQQDPEVAKETGNCLPNKDNHEQAANAYKRSVAIQADYPPAISNITGIAQISGDHESAIQLFVQAAEVSGSLSQTRMVETRYTLSMSQRDALLAHAQRP